MKLLLLLPLLLVGNSFSFQQMSVTQLAPDHQSPKLLNMGRDSAFVAERLTAIDVEAPARSLWAGDRVQARIQAQAQKRMSQMRHANEESARLSREIRVAEETRDVLLAEARNRAAEGERAQWIGERVTARIESQAMKINKGGRTANVKSTESAVQAMEYVQAEVAAKVAAADSAQWASERVAARLQSQLNRKRAAELKAQEESFRMAFETRVLSDSMIRNKAEVSAKAASAERANWAAERVEARLCTLQA